LSFPPEWLTIHDLLRDLDPNNSESLLLKKLLDVISHQRRGGTITKADLLFVDTPIKVSSQKP
jgi:hypothetical protein